MTDSLPGLIMLLARQAFSDHPTFAYIALQKHSSKFMLTAKTTSGIFSPNAVRVAATLSAAASRSQLATFFLRNDPQSLFRLP
jgi:hypothetical protein